MGHGFKLLVTIHISRRWILDYPITGCVVTDILNVVDDLVHHKWGYKTLSIRAGEDELYAP